MSKPNFESEEELENFFMTIARGFNRITSFTDKFHTKIASFEMPIKQAIIISKKEGYIKKPELEKAKWFYLSTRHLHDHDPHTKNYITELEKENQRLKNKE